MRALNIAVLVWALGAALALTDYASGGGGSFSVNLTYNATVSGDPFTFTLYGVVAFAELMKKVVAYALLLGEAVQACSPWPLPPALRGFLDAISLLATGLAILQIITGRTTEVMG